jgi:hypothetical protein
MLTNATVVDDAIRFVKYKEEKLNSPLSLNSASKEDEESNEPDHNNSGNVEEGQGTDEIPPTTINQTF